MAHREDIRAYLESQTVSGLVIDWGAGSKPVEKYVKGEADFYSVDNNSKSNPYKVWDITKPIDMGKADHAFCMEVLEHTTDPQAVMNNIYSNMKAGGTLHLSVPFLYPIHGDEDYWRFTDKGLRILAERAGFTDIKIWEITDGYIMEAIG